MISSASYNDVIFGDISIPCCAPFSAATTTSRRMNEVDAFTMQVAGSSCVASSSTPMKSKDYVQVVSDARMKFYNKRSAALEAAGAVHSMTATQFVCAKQRKERQSKVMMGRHLAAELPSTYVSLAELIPDAVWRQETMRPAACVAFGALPVANASTSLLRRDVVAACAAAVSVQLLTKFKRRTPQKRLLQKVAKATAGVPAHMRESFRTATANDMSDMSCGRKSNYYFPLHVCKILNGYFVKHPYVNKEESKGLARLCGITALQVKRWFSNRRRRVRKNSAQRVAVTMSHN